MFCTCRLEQEVSHFIGNIKAYLWYEYQVLMLPIWLHRHFTFWLSSYSSLHSGVRMETVQCKFNLLPMPIIIIMAITLGTFILICFSTVTMRFEKDDESINFW